MPKLSIDVWPKEGREVTDERWEQFLLRTLNVTSALAAEFPELTVSLPVITKIQHGGQI